MILDKKGFKPKVAELFDSSQAERAKSLVEIFPFTNVEALIVAGFLQNGKNREQAEAAFLRALTDPRWLIKKLATSPTDLEAVTGWLRSKGNSVATTFASCTAELQRLRREEDESENVLTSTIKGFADIDLRNTLLSSQSSRIQKSANSRSQFWQDSFLRVVNRLVDSIASEFNIHNNSALTQDEAFQRYPSISTLVAVMNHSWRNATELHPRQFRASDLGDAMHAIYAPYVDIFRADAFMAIPIQQATTRYGTKVVGNLRDLPAVIDAALSSG